MVELRSPLQGTLVRILEVGASVAAGDEVAVVESMKMEHTVEAPASGTVDAVASIAGAPVQAGDLLAVLSAGSGRPADDLPSDAEPGERRDLAEVRARHDIGLDPARPEAVARRRTRGQRTARENLTDLLDDGSFVEYGPLVIAAQRRRRELQDLIERTPADGLVGGVGTVAGQPVVAMTYDYTVLAGTQGLQNHRKKDRLFELAERQRLPVVLFAEGGGGRPGDTDGVGVSGLDCMAFHLFGRLSGLVPLVGITSGRCFADWSRRAPASCRWVTAPTALRSTMWSTARSKRCTTSLNGAVPRTT